MREKELAGNCCPISIVTYALSDWASVISGVPHGSVFGPIIHKRLTKRHIGEIISIWRRHKASSSIIFSSLLPRAKK